MMLLVDTKHLKASRMLLCLWAWEEFLPFSTCLCGRIVLASRFPIQICSQVVEHKVCAHEDLCAESHLAMDSFFPNFHVEQCNLWELHAENFVPFRKIELDFGGSMSWHTQPNCRLYGWLSASLCIKTLLHRICSPILFCNSVREMPSHGGFVRFPLALCLPRPSRSSKICPIAVGLRVWSKRGRLHCFFTCILIVAETVSVSSCALSFRFPLTAFSLNPINAGKFPFASGFRWNSCLNSFISGLEFSGSDLLIHASLPHSLSVPHKTPHTAPDTHQTHTTTISSNTTPHISPQTQRPHLQHNGHRVTEK